MGMGRGWEGCTLERFFVVGGGGGLNGEVFPLAGQLVFEVLLLLRQCCLFGLQHRCFHQCLLSISQRKQRCEKAGQRRMGMKGAEGKEGDVPITIRIGNLLQLFADSS